MKTDVVTSQEDLKMSCILDGLPGIDIGTHKRYLRTKVVLSCISF